MEEIWRSRQRHYNYDRLHNDYGPTKDGQLIQPVLLPKVS